MSIVAEGLGLGSQGSIVADGYGQSYRLPTGTTIYISRRLPVQALFARAIVPLIFYISKGKSLFPRIKPMVPSQSRKPRVIFRREKMHMLFRRDKIDLIFRGVT